MKTVLFAFLACWVSGPLAAQRLTQIKDIASDADVVRFWTENKLGNASARSLVPIYSDRQPVNDSLGAKNWLVTDADQNGEPDLLIFRVAGLTNIISILSRKSKYEVISPAYYNPHKYQFVYPVLGQGPGRPLILLYSQRQTGDEDTAGHSVYTRLACDTLVVEQGRLLTYAAHPQPHALEKVIIENNGMCEGNCPKITLVIDVNPHSSHAAKQLKGHHYHGSLNSQRLEELLSVVQYSNFPALANDYAVNQSDRTTTTLTIVYDGGKTKIIHDYGSSGSFTLAEVYRFVHAITWLPN